MPRYGKAVHDTRPFPTVESEAITVMGSQARALRFQIHTASLNPVVASIMRPALHDQNLIGSEGSGPITRLEVVFSYALSS